MVPMKFSRGWKWENFWLVFATFAYLIFPWVFALLAIPSLGQVYTGPHLRTAFTVAIFGLGWGVAAVSFGLACDALGMALAFALILGLGTAAGSLIPLIILDRAKLFHPEGLQIIAGVLVMIMGVSVCAWAGKMRDDQGHGQGAHLSVRSRTFYAGLAFALVSGLLDPLVNFALVFGSDLTKTAVALGGSQQFAPNVLWTLIGSAAFIPNALYCGYLLYTNRTRKLFFEAEGRAKNFALGFLMAIIWISGITIYGSSTVYLGKLGPSIGWPIFMACLIISSNVWGLFLGEWRVGGRPLKTMFAGLAILVLSVFVVGSR
jgi:L-rhamnose-H+ transport protein